MTAIEEKVRKRAAWIRRQQRWGSMSPALRLMLNRRLIEVPLDAIDYVVTHELCHIAVSHHGPEFFELLDRVLSDWERRKIRL
ncbi:M48 family metallopeptidase [Rhodospirillum sp. A1_3_36]|uniref:M48 metallopeptidase family protein n=1 Tax=Rhodospirillum sp. A1_3_36 TaxID=3391666 RepID=UPI0039A5680E